MTSALIPREEYVALERCVYLNQASLGLIPRRSTEAMVEFLVGVAQYGNVRLSDADEERILDELREAAAGLFDAPLRSVAVAGGASEALGQLAILTARAGGEVVLVASDFPSVTYPWLVARERLGMAIQWVEDSPGRDLTAALVDGIQDDTNVVCFSAVQFATGTLVDVGEVVRRAHAVGARVIVDVTQMAGAMAVSQRLWSADALVCSGYKWLSTHGGVALLVVADELLHDVPAIVGWKGTRHPFAFEPTTLARELVAATAPHGWVPYRDLDAPGASHHIVSLHHPTLSAAAIQSRLAEDRQIVVSSRGGGIRVSLHAYNDSSDIDALADAMDEASR